MAAEKKTVTPKKKRETQWEILCEPTVDVLKRNILHHVLSFQGCEPERVRKGDLYMALAYTLRDIMTEKWLQTQSSYYEEEKKRVYYLSLEFLVGRSLTNSMLNLGIYDQVKTAIEELGFEMPVIVDEEEDAALGNGGLGRLAACFMDSIATLKVPAHGYGIYYEYGLFNQQLIDGYQVEHPDNWLRYGCPWTFERKQPVYPVHFYGRLTTFQDDEGKYRVRWVDTEDVVAIPCDILVPGFQNGHVVNMRLWTARASRELDLSFFSRGDYIGAVKSKVSSETISKVLYPPDESMAGLELRLKQQYFFVAATFHDIMRRYKKKNKTFDNFSSRIAVQLNDTHPAIAIPELMRLLLDEEGLSWERSWNICINTFAYTNHTLMPEALEKWDMEMIGRVLPRHLQIICEINQRFLDLVKIQYPGDERRLQRMSIIEEGPVKRVRMAHLAIIGSHSVNGVAELHTELLKENIFPSFHEFYPGKFNSKTNGITPRRWLLLANPGLAKLITSKLGPSWITDLDKLRDLESLVDDSSFQKSWQEVKLANKERLAALINKECGVAVNPQSMFDVQVKRIHEYKRQLLNCLHVIFLYQQLVRNPEVETSPRTVIFAGKAAPSYWKAKLIIKLITSVATVINNDPRIGQKLRVVFLPNYNVSMAEVIMPAADLSEQISTAGTEASGTGNMKFSLSGALTIGTLDGANIEIMEEVGEENIFIFGMTAAEAEYERVHISRSPQRVCEENSEVAEVMDSIRDGAFSRGDKELFKPLVEGLMNPHDPYLLLRDFEDYLACQENVGRTFLDQQKWAKMSILNVARMGKFSTDRTIRQYAEEIWGIPVEKEKEVS